MSSSYARRARRLARKYPQTPDYLLEPVTPEEWQADIESYFTHLKEEPESDWPLIRSRIEALIDACPHAGVKVWAQEKLARIQATGG
jgi:hypothetical protein